MSSTINSGSILTGGYSSSGSRTPGARTPLHPGTRMDVSPITSKSETIIALDWDDTLLPTTWLDRNRCLILGQRMRPIHMKQMRPMMQSALSLLNTASQLGKVIILTNSAPGWVEASCKQFFPGLWPRVSEFECHPKPIGCHMGTFKLDKLKFEASAFRNIVSVGDGGIERTATLRLQSGEKRIKSIKFREQPSISQLLSQVDMLQQRLPDVTRHDGNLDLRSQFMTDTSMTSHNAMVRLSSILVHLTRLGQPHPSSRNGQSTALPRLCPGSSPMSNTGGRGSLGFTKDEKVHQRSALARTGESFMKSKQHSAMPSMATHGYSTIHGARDTHSSSFGNGAMNSANAYARRQAQPRTLTPARHTFENPGSFSTRYGF